MLIVSGTLLARLCVLILIRLVVFECECSGTPGVIYQFSVLATLQVDIKFRFGIEVVIMTFLVWSK